MLNLVANASEILTCLTGLVQTFTDIMVHGVYKEVDQ